MNAKKEWKPGEYYIETAKCTRCGGTGSASSLTYPDQCHKGGCKPCKGKGKLKLRVYPSGQII